MTGGPGLPWWHGATVYQVYPLSFADSDGDGYGDLPGITAHLDHLAGAPYSLGVDALWLSPIYRSPFVDFGYDVADHCDVDPRFGTLADAEELVEQAHRRGLRVLLDLVPNHTSDQHRWFEASRSARDDAQRDWYVWADPAPDGGPPNNWLSAFAAVDRAWTLDERTGQYYLHSYTPEQPDLNWRNPEVVAAMHDVMRFWLNRGVDGFRVDAPHRTAKDPLLRDNAPDVVGLRLATQTDGRRHRNIDHPDVHELMRGLRSVTDEYDDRLLVGEIGVHHLQRRLAYHGDPAVPGGDELPLVFDFGFWGNPWAAEGFRTAGERLRLLDGVPGTPTHALSNHDIPRHVTRLAPAGDDGSGPRAQARARVAAVLLLTLPGTTFLYYGEEIGTPDVPVPAERAADPDGRDPCRTPMPWSPAPGAGFTTGEPWLPIGTSTSVAVQRDDPASLLTFYRTLLARRRDDERLRHGEHRLVDAGPDVHAFLRTRAGRRPLLVVASFADSPRPAGLRLPDGEGSPYGQVVLGTGSRPDGEQVDLAGLVLAGDEALVLEL